MTEAVHKRSPTMDERNHSVFLKAVYGRARFRYGWKKQVKSSSLLPHFDYAQ
ncbi:MAG: hypothetical protein V7K26_10965 [Nostoc sp.]|uniref:hypothetical protein n=1 Tax=Nostoc sp. TaxID=1180 RepID=UPI002FF097BF